MCNLELFILPFLLSFVSIYASQNCPVSWCSSDNVPIRFPFRLGGLQKHCGYPGFKLSCSNQSKTVVKFKYSGDFLVRHIDYASQLIQLYDSGNCLPKRLMSLNLSGSPFIFYAYENYTFLSCPTQLVESRFSAIPCLSNSTVSVLATLSMSIVSSLSASCKIIKSLQIPISLAAQHGEWLSSQLGDDLELTWYSPDCYGCEAKGGICGFKSNKSQAIGCSYKAKTERPSNDIQTLRVIWLSISMPSAFAICGVVMFVILFFSHEPTRPTAKEDSAATSPDSLQPVIAMVGLDKGTIESYEKVTPGESMRLPEGPNDSTCAICLSEYHSQEILRCIPECKHCFHVGCIDEWLRMSSLCPVCRKFPNLSPADATSQSI